MALLMLSEHSTLSYISSLVRTFVIVHGISWVFCCLGGVVCSFVC